MIALVTGASSGIGREIARSLARHGINVIITARSKDKLSELKNELVDAYGVKVLCVTADLSDEKQVYELYNRVKKYKIDILINNAGFGVYGAFANSSLERETEMISVNIRAFHILFKLFLRDFKSRGCGYILNTASAAGFLPGPYFGAYYATKAYVVRLTQAVAEELRRENSGVHLSMFCPGPVNTGFEETANIRFITPLYSPAKLAEHAVREMFGGKLLISENKLTSLALYASKFVPDCVLAYFVAIFQAKREMK